MTKDLNTYLEISDMDPALELVICIFCSPYIIYWYYKYSQRIADAHIKAQIPSSGDDAIVCLILGIFGLGVVSMAIMQGNINKAWAVEQNANY
jgi:hypothetical protein